MNYQNEILPEKSMLGAAKMMKNFVVIWCGSLGGNYGGKMVVNSGRIFQNLSKPESPTLEERGRRLCRERGIRTPVGFASKHAFQACTLSHSDISLSLIHNGFDRYKIIIN